MTLAFAWGRLLAVVLPLALAAGFVVFVGYEMYTVAEDAISVPAELLLGSMSARSSQATRTILASPRAAVDALVGLGGVNQEIPGLLLPKAYGVVTTSMATSAPQRLVAFVVAVLRAHTDVPWAGIAFNDGSMYAAKRQSSGGKIQVLMRDAQDVLGQGSCLRGYQLDAQGHSYDLATGVNTTNCSYNPTDRSWYVNTVSQGAAGWGTQDSGSGVYTDAETGDLVVSATAPVYASSTLLGVALADVRLQDVSAFLSEIASTGSQHVFAFEKAHPHTLIASSTGGVVTVDSSAAAIERCECSSGEMYRILPENSNAREVRVAWDLIAEELESSGIRGNYSNTGAVFSSDWVSYVPILNMIEYEASGGLTWMVVTVTPGELYYSSTRAGLEISAPFLSIVVFGAYATFYTYTHQSRDWRFLARSVGVLVSAGAVLWVAWAAEARVATDVIVKDALAHSGLEAQEGIMDLYDKYVDANHLNARLDHIGAFDIHSAGMSSNTSLDSHFLAVLGNLREHANASAVYVGLASTGELLGASYGSNSTARVMYQGTSENLVYYGTQGSGSSEVRDVTSEAGRLYQTDSRETAWYRKGVSLGREGNSTIGKTGLSEIYAYNQTVMIVSVVTSFYNSSGVLLGVLGVDSTFDATQNILAAASSAEDTHSHSHFLAVERLAEVVASADGDTTIETSSGLLLQRNATHVSDLHLDMLELMKQARGNMTVLQGSQSRTNTNGNLLAVTAASRPSMHLDSHFGSELARWTLVQVEPTSQYYWKLNQGSTIAFSVVFFLQLFAVTVLATFFSHIHEFDSIGCGCLAKPVVGPRTRRSSKVHPTDIDVGVASEGACASCSRYFKLCKDLFTNEYDHQEPNVEELLELTRKRLVCIVERWTEDRGYDAPSPPRQRTRRPSLQPLILPARRPGSLEPIVTLSTQLQEVPGPSPSLEPLNPSSAFGSLEPLPPPQLHGNKLRNLPTEGRPLNVDSGELTAETVEDTHNRRIKSKAVVYMKQADEGHRVFETLALEAHLGEGHWLTRFHVRYLGSKLSIRCYVLGVLLFGLTNVVDTETLEVPIQSILCVYLTLDTLLVAYVEFVTDNFIRLHSVWSVALLAGIWLAHLLRVVAICDGVAFASFLVPFLLIPRSQDLRYAVKVIWKALASAITVFYLLFFTVAVTAIMLNLFFFHEFSGPKSEMLGSSVDNFIDTWVSMFVLLCGGENYEDLVFQGYSANMASWVFFLPFSILGNFLLMSLVIATFQDTYRKHKKQLAEMKEQQRRTRLCVPFVLWTWDQAQPQDQYNVFSKTFSPALKRDDFVSLMRDFWNARNLRFESMRSTLTTTEAFRQSVRSFSLEALCACPITSDVPEEYLAREIFSTIDRDASETISFPEFVLVLGISRCVEMLSRRDDVNSLNDQLRGSRVIAARWESAVDVARSSMRAAKRAGKSEEARGKQQQQLERLERFCAIAVLNLQRLQRAADRSCLIFNRIPWAGMDSVLLTLIITQAFTLSLYGNEKEVNQEAVLQYSNAVNLLFSVEMVARIHSAGGVDAYLNDNRRPWTSIVNCYQLGMVAFSTAGSLLFYCLPSVPQRISVGVMCLNLFRAFFLEEKATKLLYSFSFGFKPLLAYAGLFYILFCGFSWVAYTVFHGRVHLEYQHFDTFGQTLLTMFQVFLGEGWYVVMENAASQTTKTAVWFFVLYVVLCRIIVADFMVGMVIDLYHTANGLSETHVGQVEMIFARQCYGLDTDLKTDLVNSLGVVGSVIYQPVMRDLSGLAIMEHKFGSDILGQHGGDIAEWAAITLQRRVRASRGRRRARLAESDESLGPVVPKGRILKTDEDVESNPVGDDR
eukprot:TRINITY_DN3422_c0_g1_i2.p1 TRINITY_DN3422_c0_g1~~TRINITY_DN3422_c0_g1_i2.p1  ORF type:complete len:1834 (+),score=306.62 TRINITY_DN3422_c0_g1_i2:179-5680(+)